MLKVQFSVTGWYIEQPMASKDVNHGLFERKALMLHTMPVTTVSYWGNAMPCSLRMRELLSVIPTITVMPAETIAGASFDAAVGWLVSP